MNGGGNKRTRRLAGWVVLSLIPLTFVGLAALAGQLLELAVGWSLAALLGLAAYVGVRLLDGTEDAHD